MQRFIEKTDGDANILGLFWSLIAICFVAIAADIARTFSFQAGLQSAADTAGMAVSAEYARTKDIAKAKAAGVAVAAEIMGSSAYLTADDIVFGQYDADATPPTMTENLTEFDAVHVFANALDDNALYQYFFQFVGLDSFDVSAETVYALEVGSVKEPLISTCGNDTTFITHGHFGTLSLNMQTEDPSISNAPYPTHCIHTNRNNGIDMYDGGDPAEKMGFFVAPDSSNGGENISLSKSGRAHLNDLDPLFITSDDSKINNMTELELITEERFIETIFYWQIQEYFNGIFNYIEDTKIKKNSNSISYTYPWTGGASLEINGINQWAQWIMCKDHFEQYQILATSQGHGILPRAIIPEYTCFNVYIFDENFGTVNISRLEDNIIVLAYGDINYTGSTSGAVSRADTGSFDAKNVVLMARGSISFGSGAPLDDQYEWTWANYDHILNLQNSFIFALNKNSRNDHDAYDERCADVAECTYFVYEDGLGNTWARRNHQTRTPRTYADFDDRNFINITLNLGTPDWCDGNDHFNSYLLGLDDFVFNEQVVSVDSDWHNLYKNDPKSQANFHSVYASGLKFIGGNTELYTSGSYFEVGEEIYFRRISIQNCPHLLISDVLPRANIESTYLNGADILNSLGAGYTPLGETILDENLSQPQDNDYAAEYVIENEEALVH